MSKMTYWMVLSCAWLGLAGIQNTAADIALVSAPEQHVSSVSANGFSMVTAMSSTGRFILFISSAGDLVTNAPNNFSQLFLRDRALGTTVLVSATPGGAAADGISFGLFVDDAGQQIVFQSDASDLGPKDDNGDTDIYMRDLLTGAHTLLSTSTNGAAGNGASRYPITTPDGLFVAFESAASDLVANDTNRAVDVFVRDVKMGLITRASQLPKGFSGVTQADNELNGMSTNGQYVLFTSYCAKTSAASQIAKHVFLRDTVSQTTYWISSNIPPMNQNLFAGLDCCKASMTPDAKYLVFMAARPGRLVSPADAVVCRHDFLTGTTTVIATNPVVVLADGTENLGAVISEDGRFVAYTLSGSAPAAMSQVYRWDFVTGSNTLVSVSADGITSGNAASDSPLISSDGRMVLFGTLASNLVTQDIHAEWNLILRDMDTGRSRLVSVNSDGLSGADADLSTVCMTPDSRSIAFDSRSAMIVPGDANSDYDAFVRNMDSDATELISVPDPRAASLTVPGLHGAFPPSISSDGRFIVFSSSSDMLAAGDANLGYNAFIRDTVAGTTRLATVNQANTGAQNGGLSAPPSVTDDGRFVAFTCTGSDLTPMDTNRSPDVYVRDVWNGTNILVSKNIYGMAGGAARDLAPLIAPRGDFILYPSTAPNMVGGVSSSGRQWIYKYDMESGSNVNIPYPSPLFSLYHCTILSTSHDRQTAAIGFNLSGTSSVIWVGVYDLRVGRYLFCTNNVYISASLSGDGQRLAYVVRQAADATFQLEYVDVAHQSNATLISINGAMINNYCLNNDGSRVAYEVVPPSSMPSSWTQVYVWDAAAGSNSLVSVNQDGQAAHGRSKLVGITPDGNRVLFNSGAEDMVTTDHNGWTDVYVRDLVVNQTRLLSENRNHGGGGNGLSVATALSADGNSVVFTSTASDLIPNDFNGEADVFVVRIIDPNADADGDGLPDDWERLYFKDLSHSANEDADQDGSSNLAELEAGTNPVDPESVLRISGLAPQPGSGLRLTWAAVSGKSYRLQYKDNLADPAWSDVAGDITPAGAVGEKNIPSTDREYRYYRVMVVK